MMLNTFKNFLVESYLTEAAASSEVAADDKGKLHELLLAKHLHPDKELPTHHRAVSEVEGHSGTPQQVHDKLQKKISPEAYDEIDKAAQGSAKELISHLKKEGHLHENSKIGDVHWTSNRDTATAKGDHEKTTGVKDPNSNADLIVTLKNKKGEVTGYHGVSAKYGTNKEPNYKNPGVDSLEKMADLKSGTINSALASHHADMAKLGYVGTVEERHAKYKADTMGIDKVKSEKKRFDTLLATGKKLSRKEQIMHDHLNRFSGAYDQSPDKQHFLDQSSRRASMAEESGRASRAVAAKRITAGMAKKSDPELRKIISDSVSPPTVIPHTVVHSHIQESGESKPIIKNAEDIGKTHLDKFEGLHIAKDKAGGSVTVRGYHKDTGKLTNVATWGLKSQSGPHKGVNATLTLK
jgi:hypothetical protein